MDDGRTFLQEDGGGGGGGTTGRFFFVSRERIFEKGKKVEEHTIRERGRTREREKEREEEGRERRRNSRKRNAQRCWRHQQTRRCGDAGGDEDEGEDEDVETCPLCCNDMDGPIVFKPCKCGYKYARGVGIKSWKLGSARRGSARRVDRTTTRLLEFDAEQVA